MPIVVKGTKLTPEFTQALRSIVEGVKDLRAKDLVSRAREVSDGVEIPSGYKELLIAIQAKYPETVLTPINEEEMRKNRIDSNNYFLSRFKEYNQDYMASDNNALLQIISTPPEFFNLERATEFLTKALSKVSPSPNHKYKIFAKYSVAKAIREDVAADKFTGADGSSIKGRCTVISYKFVPDGPKLPMKGTKLEVVIPATDIEKIFAVLNDANLFARIPRIKFVNLIRRTNTRKEIRQNRESVNKTESYQKKTKQQKLREGKAQGAQGKKDTNKEISVKLADGKKPKRNNSSRFPYIVRINNIPSQLSFDLLKQNLDKEEHASILKAIAESRKKMVVDQDPSSETFLCTEENGKIIEEAFNAMTVNGQQIEAELIKVK